jgi:hypothetical protein
MPPTGPPPGPPPADPRTYPINPTKLRAALDWATLQVAAVMVGLPDDDPVVIEGHRFKNSFAALAMYLGDVDRGHAIRLILDPDTPPDEAARHDPAFAPRNRRAG